MREIFLKKSIIFSFIFLLISISGGILVFFATQWGPWAFSDSAAYLNCAKNLNTGLGVTLASENGKLYPFSIFPPFYAFVLSRFSLLTNDYILAARILDALCFGLLIFLISWGTQSLSHNIYFSIFSGLFVLCAPIMLENNTGLMSEPLFFPLMYGSYFSMLFYLKDHKKIWLVLSFILTILASLTRYIGVFLCLLNPLLLLFYDQPTWKERIKKGVLFGFFSLLPVMLWLITRKTDSKEIGGRYFFIPADLKQRILIFSRDTVTVLQKWIPYMGYRINLIPDSLKLELVVAFSMFLFVVDFILYIKRKSARSKVWWRLIFSSALCIMVYLIVLLGTYLFASMAPDLISRMYSPLLPSFVFLFLSEIALFLENMKGIGKKYAVVVLLFFSIVALRYNILRTWTFVSEMHENGYGFTSKAIQSSGFLRSVKSLPTDKPMIANSPALVFFYTNHMPYELENIVYGRLGSGKSELDVIFSTQHTALILDYASIRNTYPDWQQRVASLTNGLEIYYQDAIGGIYYSNE